MAGPVKKPPHSPRSPWRKGPNCKSLRALASYNRYKKKGASA